MAKTPREVIARHLTSNWSRLARESGAHVYREEADKLLRALAAAGCSVVENYEIARAITHALIEAGHIERSKFRAVSLLIKAQFDATASTPTPTSSGEKG